MKTITIEKIRVVTTKKGFIALDIMAEGDDWRRLDIIRMGDKLEVDFGVIDGGSILSFPVADRIQ